MRRRAVLASIATLPGLAGCLGGSDGNGSRGDPDGGTDGGGDGDTGGNGPSGPTAALNQLSGQPYLGEPPADADQLIVAFEDPGCPSCASFHEERLDDLEAELIEPGDATLVWRPLRYVSQFAPWNEEAIHAVLETTARDVDAAWSLLDFYYGNQGDVSASSVADQTRSFVAEETSVEADPVVAAMEESAHADLLGASESAASDAGVASTPTFLLFDGQTHVTTITGGATAVEFAAAFQA